MKISTRASGDRRNDSLFKVALEEVSPRPVFIIGLQRSGTTFLYQMLTSVFPVASLTVYHVINYDRILVEHREGTAAAAQQQLDKIFRSWNMATRQIDEVALSHATPEEYGWLMRSQSRFFHTSAKTAPLLDEICRKLQLTSPSAQNVILKNPFDTGYVHEILSVFPDARFLFIQRDPMAIVNSHFRIAKYFGTNKDPFLELLFSKITLGWTWTWMQRILRKVLGEKWHGQIALLFILRSVTQKLKQLEISWAAIPPDQRLALDYEELMSDQDGVIKRVAAFLELSPRRDPVYEKPNPRNLSLLPEVAALETRFRRRLKERGIAQQPLDKIHQLSRKAQG